MSKHNIGLLTEYAEVSLSRILQWCNRDVGSQNAGTQMPGAHNVDTQNADTPIAGSHHVDSGSAGTDSPDRSRFDVDVSKFLAARGIPEHEPLEAYGLGSSGIADLGAYEWTTLIPRENLITQIQGALAEYGSVVLLGAVRSGKSQLLQMLLASPQVQTQYPRRVVLDCMALRGRGYQALSREAIFFLCTDPDERDLYLSPVASDNESATSKDDASSPTGGYSTNASSSTSTADPADTALNRYFRSGVIDDGLLIVEHAERIAPGFESERWLSMILQEAHARRARVCVMCAAGHVENIPHRKVLGSLPGLMIPDLTLEEIAAGLDREFLRPYLTSGLTVKRVHRISGGRPGIVRDLLRFLVTECAGREISGKRISGRKALSTFARQQIAQYSVECQYLVEVLRNRPDSLLNPIARASGRLLTQALVSGAIIKASGHFAFSSPIIARRYRMLSRPENLLWMASSGEPEVILAKRGFAELIGYSMANSIHAAASPAVSFARYAQALKHFGLRNIEVHIRDRDNARLWSKIFTDDSSHPVPPEEWRPLVPEEEAEFARAVRTGRRVMDTNEHIWLPSIGPRGYVEVLTKGRLSEEPHTYSGRIRIRLLWNTVLMLESALATAAERLLLKRRLRMNSRALYRMQAIKSADTRSQSVMDGFLQQANCNAVAVFEKSGSSWRVADLRIIRIGDHTAKWMTLLADANSVRLDEIATHPSGRGLVLGDKELAHVFPYLFWRKRSVAMSLNPVCAEGKGGLKLVAFIFVGTSAHDISGARQKQLFLMAPVASATVNTSESLESP